MATAVENHDATAPGGGRRRRWVQKALATAAAVTLALTTVVVGGVSAAYADGESSDAVAPQSIVVADETAPEVQADSVAAPVAETTEAPLAEPPAAAPEASDIVAVESEGVPAVDETAQPAAPPVAASDTSTAPVATETAARGPQQAAVTISGAALADNGGKPLVVGQSIAFSANWSVPMDTQPGDYFQLTLPSQFAPVSRNVFHLFENGGSTVLADCTWEGVTATCVFTERVVDIHSGNIWFTLSATAETDEGQTDIDFLLGAATFGVTLPVGGITPKPTPTPGTGTGTSTPTATKAPVSASKWGYADYDSGRFNWSVTIPAAGGTLSLVDTIDASEGFELHHFIADSAVLYKNVVDDEGMLTTWVKDASFTASSYTISADGRTLTIDGHALDTTAAYRLNYKTEADGILFTGDRVGNTVSLRGQDYTASASFKALAGGGGDPSALGRFAIQKVVTGERASEVPTDTVFHVKATWSGGGQDIDLRADGTTVTSQRVPAGTKITLSEVDLPSITDVVWGAAKITGEGVVDNGDGTFSVTPQAGDVLKLVLTNTATPRPLVPGEFSIEKLLDGAAASKVPAGTEFTVSYVVGDGEPVTATLTVGEPLVVTGVPAGSTVTITEVDLPEVADVVWGAPAFQVGDGEAAETASFTVGEAQQVEVVLTNTATSTPTVVTVDPGKPAVPSASQPTGTRLAMTGGELALWVPLTALALLVSGIVMVVTFRRTQP
ncbi:DUF5979 domain-containing protein [Microbacterium sp.]|uniref:DUF5979 domain-containing protein n=1 Tax=Microbacterium sp. TaxID=51671 RepID=UPI0039E3E11B